MRGRPSPIRRHLATRHGKAHAALLAVLAAYAVFFIWLEFFHRTDIVLSAELHGERLNFTVINPGLAAFAVDGMAVGEYGTKLRSSCLAGLFTPRLGAIITYGRRGDGPVDIVVEPPAAGEGQGAGGIAGRYDPRDGSASLTLSSVTEIATDARCGKPGYVEFPVWGDARIGRTPRPPRDAGLPEPSLLLDGTLKISARSLWRGFIYPLTTVPIPVGAELSTPAHSGDPSFWWGVVSANPSQPGLSMQLGTEAPAIALKRPNRTVPDVIEARSMAQITDDPAIINWHILIVILGALALCSDWIGEHLHSLLHREPDELS